MVRRHVAPGKAVPLHPEAAAFADHYGYAIDVLAAYRPTGKGRVERQVDIVRAHVLAGRSFDRLAELDAAFAAWLPIRRAQVHRTHGQVIAERAGADRAALTPLPAIPYLVQPHSSQGPRRAAGRTRATAKILPHFSPEPPHDQQHSRPLAARWREGRTCAGDRPDRPDMQWSTVQLRSSPGNA